jgi:hypothetical protein
MVQEVKWDDAMVEDGPRIPKFKFSKEEKNYKKRIFFLPRLLKDDVHTKEGYGVFKCLASSGRCPACEAGLRASPRFGLFVVVYATTPEGVLKTPFGYDVLVMVKSDKPSQYGRINDLHKQYGNEMFKHDFVVSAENTEYHMFNYNIDLDCAWLKQPNKDAIKEDFKAKMAEFDANLGKIIAPEITEKTMELLMAGKIPNRYTTKNQKVPAGDQPAQGQTSQTQTQATLPLAASTATVPVTSVQPSVSTPPKANEGGATKSDLDILNELS